MAINPHYSIEEIDGVRCSVVEKKITAERAAYLKTILENSGQVVRSVTDETGAVTLGVTDETFNVLTSLYARALKTSQGKLVTPAIWFQGVQTGDFYWDYHE